MNEEQKKIVDKIKEDNKHFDETHKSWIEYSKGRIIIGVIFVIILIIIYCIIN